MDEFHFTINQPQEVALRFATPKEYPSKFPKGGPSYMFSLADGRVMWLPRQAAERIAQIAPLTGEPIQIAQIERMSERSKVQDWDVRRVFAPG